jgi:hypothetical protein
VYNAISRGPAIITTGTRTLTASEVFGSVVTVSGVPPFTPYTITLPSPAAVAGAQFEMMLNVGIPITIATPVGWIGGMSGGYEATKVLSNATSSQHNRFFSDGANWNMISQAGYTHFGELVAPTAVSAPEYRLNGNNITTLFAPKASPTLTGTTTAATLNATSVSTQTLSATGNATVQGTLTTNNDLIITTAAPSYGRVMSTDQYHAIILRGDISYSQPGYTVVGGQAVTTFVQFGGTWPFRHVNTASNVLLFEITPTAVNVPTALQIGGLSTDTLYMARPWAHCLINGNNLTIQPSSDVGRLTPTITRTSGQAVGAYDITFSSHPRSFNYASSVQPRLDTGLAFAVISNVQANSLKIRTYNASQSLADIQFSLIIFS